MKYVEVIIPSNRPQLAVQCQNSLRPYKGIIVDAKLQGKISYSKIMNFIITDYPHELILICNDKGRPKPQDVDKVVELLDRGFGMAWLHPFGFGGFYKDVIRKIGFYDERFVDGNYEDCDMTRRLKEADIALYESFDIEWVQIKSSWKASKSEKFFKQKWDGFNRKLPEAPLNYDIGSYQGRAFLPWKETVSSSIPKTLLE